MHSRVDIDLEKDGYLPDPSTSEWFAKLERHLAERPWWRVHIYLPIKWFWQAHNPMTYAREIKHFIQRGRKGYSGRDLWSLGTYSIKILRDGMLDSMPHQYSYPGEFAFMDPNDWTSPERDDGAEEWEAIQHTIIYGLDHIIKVMDWDETCTCCGKYCKDRECIIIQDTYDLLIPNWLNLGD